MSLYPIVYHSNRAKEETYLKLNDDIFALKGCGRDIILVLFSGGRDSFLTVSGYAARGKELRLLSINNGAILDEQYFVKAAKRLTKRFKRVRMEGLYCTWSLLHRVNQSFYTSSLETLGSKYPLLTPAQLCCFHCQCAMWTAAISYAIMHNINYIAAGYKNGDHFCIGEHWFLEELQSLANEFSSQSEQLNLVFPLYDVNISTIEEDLLLTDFGFIPKFLEPQCTLGRPQQKMSEEESFQLHLYFKESVLNIMRREINSLKTVFAYISLSNTSTLSLDTLE